MRSAPIFLLLASAAALRAQPAAPGDTTITADGPSEMIPGDTGTEFILHNHVVVDGGGLHLTCDLLDVEAGKMSPAQAAAGAAAQLQKARHVVASGHVRIVNGDYVANCAHAEMFPQENRIVLTGDCVVNFVKEGGSWSGEKIVLTKNAQGHWIAASQGPSQARVPYQMPQLKPADDQPANGARSGPPPVAK